MTCDGKHPRETEIGQNLGLGVVGEKPSKMNAPLAVVGFVDDLFGTRELLVTGHLAHGFAEAAGGESGEGGGVEVLGLGPGSPPQAYAGGMGGVVPAILT